MTQLVIFLKILGHKYFGPEIDIWSMGIVLYGMFEAKFPFETVASVLDGKFVDPLDISLSMILYLLLYLQVY